MLYSSWFPNLNRQSYNKLVVKQGAEYTSMGDLFLKKFKNPLVLGLDHPKMKNFYKINSKIDYLRKTKICLTLKQYI